ncbi:unnamed protein product [Prorocentrum cordatum]|uniref:Uncharacterized protein n=1 Tax=Prorocentrum cordatum TaxID=2364126 RepID=A0ABN9X1L0_9DINO|nr:unnamed protein product [Polarella glacialis]
MSRRPAGAGHAGPRASSRRFKGRVRAARASRQAAPAGAPAARRALRAALARAEAAAAAEGPRAGAAPRAAAAAGAALPRAAAAAPVGAWPCEAARGAAEAPEEGRGEAFNVEDEWLEPAVTKGPERKAPERHYSAYPTPAKLGPRRGEAPIVDVELDGLVTFEVLGPAADAGGRQSKFGRVGFHAVFEVAHLGAEREEESIQMGVAFEGPSEVPLMHFCPVSTDHSKCLCGQEGSGSKFYDAAIIHVGRWRYSKLPFVGHAGEGASRAKVIKVINAARAKAKAKERPSSATKPGQPPTPDKLESLRDRLANGELGLQPAAQRRSAGPVARLRSDSPRPREAGGDAGVEEVEELEEPSARRGCSGKRSDRMGEDRQSLQGRILSKASVQGGANSQPRHLGVAGGGAASVMEGAGRQGTLKDENEKSDMKCAKLQSEGQGKGRGKGRGGGKGKDSKSDLPKPGAPAFFVKMRQAAKAERRRSAELTWLVQRALERLRQLIQPDAIMGTDLAAFGELLRARLPAKLPGVGSSAAAAPDGGFSGKGLEAWLECCIVALNAMWLEGDARWPKFSALGQERHVAAARVRAFWILERRVEAFWRPQSEPLPSAPASTFLASRSISYTGEAVRRAEELSCCLGCRPRIGALRGGSWTCDEDERMARWFNDPLSTLMPLDRAPVRPKPGRARCERESLLPLARGLLERGLVIPIREADLLKIQGEPLLNGLFGVPKSQVAPEGPEGREVLRLIMNLAATKEVPLDFGGDLGALPYFAQWRSIVLGPDEELARSFDDFKGAFYVFRLPDAWAPLFAFDAVVDAASPGLGAPFGGQVYLGAARKDRSFPALRGGSALRELWQVYCDDADYAELARRCSEPAGGFAAGARDRYAQRDVPLSEKAALCAQLTAHLLAEAVSRKEAQMVARHWCHMSCFRRERGTVFRRLRRGIARWDGGKRSLPSADVCAELALALSLLPLRESDLRAPAGSAITASDASERGGGACWAVCLRASAKVFEPARRAVQQRWPEGVGPGDVRSIAAESLRGLLARAPHLRVLFVLGGSPCQGAARANVAAGGWAEARAQLVEHIPRVATLPREACPELVALPLAENTSSMSEGGRRRFTRALGSVPIDHWASGCSPVRGPRLHWLDFPLGPQGRSEGHGIFWVEWLESGASHPRGEHGAWATSMRPIPREKPPVAPAGLARAGRAARARWGADRYRYAPCQHKLGNVVYDRQGCPRPLTSAERAVPLGFPVKHCLRAAPKSAGLSGREVEDVRCGLHSNAFSAPVVAMLLGRGLLAAGALARPPTIAERWGARGAQAGECLGQLPGNAPSDTSSKEVRSAACEGLARSAIFEGSDISRAGTSTT